MPRGGLGRYHDAGGYPHSPKVGVEGSSGIDWEGLLKVFLVGAAVVVVAKATARGGQSSSAPVRRTLPPQPIPSWTKYAVGGAVATPAVWKGGKTIYDWLKSLDPPAQQASPSSIPQNAPPAPPMPGYKASASQATEDWLHPILARLNEQLNNARFKTQDSAPPAWSPPPDSKWQRLAPHPSVGAIVGRRGGGKSALGYRLLELQRGRAAYYVVGPWSMRKLLPDWIGVVQDMTDVPSDALVLIDEAYLLLHSRDSMSRTGRSIGPMINLSRQRRLSLIFISQEARQIDVNILNQLDWMAIKEPSELSMGFERRELRRCTEKA